MKNSVYAMMVENGNRSQRDEIEYAVEMEEYIKDVCKKLPNDRLLGTPSSSFAKIKAKEALKKTFMTSSGASCNYGNSKSILSRYADSLRYEGNSVSEPSFQLYIKDDVLEGKFKYKVTLQEGSKTWSACGQACRSKCKS